METALLVAGIVCGASLSVFMWVVTIVVWRDR